MEINGKAAVVSGAGSGIGRAIALALVLKGAKVIVADIDEKGGRETVDLLGARGGVGVFRRCDVTRTEDLAAAFAACLEHFGCFDIVCNNAGIGEREDLFTGESREFERVVDIDLTAVIDATRIAVREMRRLGGGVIVNTASMGGLLPMPNNPVYAAAKAGVVNFSRSLGYLSAEGIRVNAVCPTFTDTPLVHQGGEEGEARLEDLKKMVGGILRPGDVAAGVIQLVEDDSKAGAIMRVTLNRGIDYAREIRPF